MDLVDLNLFSILAIMRNKRSLFNHTGKNMIKYCSYQVPEKSRKRVVAHAGRG